MWTRLDIDQEQRIALCIPTRYRCRRTAFRRSSQTVRATLGYVYGALVLLVVCIPARLLVVLYSSGLT